MSHNSFGRGRGFGSRGSRAIGSFCRPRFLRPPFRHAGPPRPGHPGSFGMPWQPNNMMFQPGPGNPQFRPGGRRRRICSYDVRFPPPNRLPVPASPDCEEVARPLASNRQPEDNQTCNAPQMPLLGSEEERQQTIAKTADRLKQKLSSFSGDDTSIWNDDVTLPSAVDDCAESRTLGGREPPELNLTESDFKSIGRIQDSDRDTSRLDVQDLTTDTPDIAGDARIGLTPSENQSDADATFNNQMTNVEVPENREIFPQDSNTETESSRVHLNESIDEPCDFERADDSQDADVSAGNRLSQPDIIQCDVPPVNILQDHQCDQWDVPQEVEATVTLEEQDVTKSPSLQDAQSHSLILSDQDASLSNTLHGEARLVANPETRDNVANSQPAYASSSTSDNGTLTQAAPCNVPVLDNVVLDKRLPKLKENSFHGGPPRLSPHIEQELPIDFDPSTPPPILMKQDQPVNVLPPLIHDLPPLFNPAEPPPNMRVALTLPHESPITGWNVNAPNQVPAVYNAEVHMDLNAHVGFAPQPLPLEMPGQSNVFLAPPLDAMSFTPLFSMPPSGHPVMPTVPLMPQPQILPHNACVPPSSSPEPLPFSDCNVNKDDVLNDMQEAMKFAQEMTSIGESIAGESAAESTTERYDEMSSKADTTPPTPERGRTSTTPVSGNVEAISLPPGKPRARPIKLKRPKRADVHSEQSQVPEEQIPSSNDTPPEEIVIQDDVSARSKDASIANEQDRPKVVFNLNNKTIKVKATWQEETRIRARVREKRNGMTQQQPAGTTETTCAATAAPVTRKNLTNMARRMNMKKSERSASRTVPSEMTTVTSAPPFHRKLQRDAYKEISQPSDASSVPHASAQPISRRTRSRAKRPGESSRSEISWKTNVINRFLKMSRNDIYNMVNSTSLRKFDVIMKRLVKEQRPTLSLEMRRAQDEKMKLYDQQEFMKQLNQMLDTEAAVSITDLPTEFIHHLNEVLQLDIQPDDQVEPAAAAAAVSQPGYSEMDAGLALDPTTYSAEYAAAASANSTVGDEYVRNKSHATIKPTYDRDTQMHNRINELNVRDDTCSTVISNKSSSLSSKLSALQHDVDDIFSEITKKNHAPTALMRKEYCIAGQARSARRLDDNASSRSSRGSQKDAHLDDDRARRTENCARWIEKCDKWKKKEQHEYTYRNLTKEEWEARYGTQADAVSSLPAVASLSAAASSSSYAAVASTAAIASSSGIGMAFSSAVSPPALAAPFARALMCNKSLLATLQSENSYPRRRHSSESMKHSGAKHRHEKEKHKRSRRHSDDRRHDGEHSEGNSNTSDSSSSSSSSDSSDSSDQEANVTKLLRVIKENERVAKKITLNEAIRDEVNAEIERERKQKRKKARKDSRNARRKAKRIRHRRKKRQSKKASTSDDSSSGKDGNDDNDNDDEREEEEDRMRLLTETEIKKEFAEDAAVQQEVIIKEEVDIGQEENTADQFANLHVSSNVELSHDSSAFLAAQEIPALTGASALRSCSRNKQLTSATSTSPTQPKTKAQLKQMPADMNDNKVPLNVFTAIPESLITGEMASSWNKPREAIDISCNRSATQAALVSDNVADRSDAATETVRSSCDRSNGSAVSQTDAAAATLTDLSTVNTQTETSATSNVSSKALSVSGVTVTNTQKSAGTSRKIDIKTYYERTIQRRMNEQTGLKKSDACATSQQDSPLAEKITEPASNKSVPVSNNNNNNTDSLQDPRLMSPGRLAATARSLTSGKGSVARTVPGKHVRQAPKRAKSSELTETTLKPKEDPDRVIGIGSIVKKASVSSGDTEKTGAASSVGAESKIKSAKAKSKPKPRAKAEVNREETKEGSSQQSAASLDPMKFKNIRSEGGKELKLKKETVKKISRARKKPAIVASKSPLSTKTRRRSVEGGTAKTADNAEKIVVESTEEEAVSNSVLELPPVTASNTNLAEIEKREDERAEELSEIAEIEKREDERAEEVSENVSKLDVSTPPEILLRAEASGNNDERDEKDLLPSSEIRSFDSMNPNDTEPPLNPENEVRKSDKEDSVESNSNVPATIADDDNDDDDDDDDAASGIPESGITQRSENVDTKDVLVNTYKSASAEEGGPMLGEVVESPSLSNENSAERQDRLEEAVISPDSIGSPFKGFLQESIMAFEQSNLFNLELNEIDGDKDREPTSSEKSDTEMPEESREGHVVEQNSPVEAVTTAVLRDEVDNVVDIDETSGADVRLDDDKNFTLNAELEMKESMFIINEEEIIHDETRPKDLTDKLTTTTDPSLSDAVDTAISDSDHPLRLPDSQGAEHLSNHHVYLETNLSPEKTTCDKLTSDFESDEHLVNDMFYLDDRLQDAGEYDDNKDDEHFSMHPESPRYDITPAVTPETTMIAPDADLSAAEIRKSERLISGEYDFKDISAVNNDCSLLSRADDSPERETHAESILNVPIKTDPQEAATDDFANVSPINNTVATDESTLLITLDKDDALAKSLNNTVVTTDESALLVTLDKPQENTMDLTDNQTPAWHSDVPHDKEVENVLKTNNNTAPESVNVNMISSTQTAVDEGRTSSQENDASAGQKNKAISSFEKRLCGIQPNPVVELEKMKELDDMLRRKLERESPEKSEQASYKEQKKRKSAMLHKIRHKHSSSRYRSGKKESGLPAKKLKDKKQTGSFTTKEAILARMLDIDIEMQNLMMEKMKLHEMLQKHSTDDSTGNPTTASEIKVDDAVAVQLPPAVLPPMSTLALTQNAEASREKSEQEKLAPAKRSPSKQRKRIVEDASSEDNEVSTPYVQRSKTPVIQWKKKPRLGPTGRRRTNEEEADEDDTDDETIPTKQVSKSSPSKKAGSSIDAPGKVTQRDERLDSNAAVTIREPEADARTGKKAASDTDNKSMKHTIQSDSRQASTERGTDDLNVEKRNDVPTATGKTVRASSQPRSVQVHSTPLSIYSDDSTWDSMARNTMSEMHERRMSTGLALLDEALKKQQTITKRMKAIARKRKKRQLNTFLKTVDKLSLEEEELPLSKLYIRKLQQKRDLLDTLSQRKDEPSIPGDHQRRNMDEVINAVAENRVKDLYEGARLEAQASTDVPATSDAPCVPSKPVKHEFYVDVEANANADWASREKEMSMEHVAVQQQQQDSNDTSAVEVSNHAFKAVSQEAIALYSERNVEPDSSITPEETSTGQQESQERERLDSKDPDHIPTRNFDIKVSVPKILIRDDFSLELLQKFKDPEVSTAGGAGLVDSTTNTSSAEKPREEQEKNSPADLPIARTSGTDGNPIEGTTRVIERGNDATDASSDKRDTCELQKRDADNATADNVKKEKLDIAKRGYSDITGSEDSGDSVGCKNDKMRDSAHDSNSSDSIAERVGPKEEKLNAEFEQFSCGTIIPQRDDRRNEGNASCLAGEERADAKSKLQILEEAPGDDHGTGNTTPADRMSEKSSEESNETSQKLDLERVSTSITLSFNRTMEKGGEAKRIRRKSGGRLTPVRRSTRYYDNIKPGKANEGNSNSSEQDSSSHERITIIRHRSKSPAAMLHDERSTGSSGRKPRAPQKEPGTSKKVLADAESETRAGRAAGKPSQGVIAESTAGKRKHTMWEMTNCKVRIIDCRRTHLKPHVPSELLTGLGIIAINPTAPSDMSCTQHAAHDKNTVTMPAASFSEKSSSLELKDRACDKDKTDIEILEEKPVKKINEILDLAQESTSRETNADEQAPTRTQYTVHKGPILDIKIFGNSFLAASEDGKIYRYSQTSNGILNIYKGHKSAVTCLHIYKSDGVGVNKDLVYSGSLDGTLRCYNIKTGGLVKSPVHVNSPIQCMDQSWGMIFVGTKSGHVSRFYIKGGVIRESSIQFSDNSVLALKATNEGPRKILIVASRSQPVTIRDAISGLFLRTISNQKNHTVYSLLRHHNLIYCGTSNTSITVFDFTTGEQTIQYEAGVGIVCMRLYEQLLFAGCYDGNIYVFDTNNRKLICSIRGPGNMLLSLEVVNDKIIAGTKDKRLHSWQMPNQVRALLQKLS